LTEQANSISSTQTFQSLCSWLRCQQHSPNSG